MKKIIITLLLSIVSTFLFTSCGNNEKENVQNKPHYNGEAEIMGVPVYGKSSDFISKISTFGNVKSMDTSFLHNNTTVIEWFFEGPSSERDCWSYEWFWNEDSVFISHIRLWQINEQIARVEVYYRNTKMLNDVIVEKYKKYDNFTQIYDSIDTRRVEAHYKLGKTEITIGVPESHYWRGHGYKKWQIIKYDNQDVWNEDEQKEKDNDKGQLKNCI